MVKVQRAINQTEKNGQKKNAIKTLISMWTSSPSLVLSV